MNKDDTLKTLDSMQPSEGEADEQFLGRLMEGAREKSNHVRLANLAKGRMIRSTRATLRKGNPLTLATMDLILALADLPPKKRRAQIRTLVSHCGPADKEKVEPMLDPILQYADRLGRLPRKERKKVFVAMSSIIDEREKTRQKGLRDARDYLDSLKTIQTPDGCSITWIH